MKAVTTIAVILSAAVLSGVVGCASAPVNHDVVYGACQDVSVGRATALAFDPPVTYYAPPLDFDRANRAPGAYVGFDSTITYTYTRMDDRQSYDQNSRGNGRFRGSSSSSVERQSITSTVGIRTK